MNARALAIVLTSFTATLASAADPQLLKLIMPDAKVVSGVDVGHVKTTPFGQFFLSQFLGNADFNTLVGATGFDPRNDVSEIVMASSGDPKKKSALIVMRGHFDSARIIPLIQASGAKSETYQGIVLFSEMGGAPQALAFLDNTVVISGDPDSVRGAIDRRSSISGLPAELGSKIVQISSNQDAWVVSLAPLSALGAVAPDKNMRGALQGDIFKSVQQSSGAVRFGAAVEVSGELTSRSSADASSIADVLKFLLSLAQVNAPPGQAAQFASLLGNFTVTAESNAVKLTGVIPELDFEAALRSASGKALRPTPKI